MQLFLNYNVREHWQIFQQLFIMKKEVTVTIPQPWRLKILKLSFNKL